MSFFHKLSAADSGCTRGYHLIALVCSMKCEYNTHSLMKNSQLSGRFFRMRWARSSMEEQWPFKPLVLGSSPSALTLILLREDFWFWVPAGDVIRIPVRSLKPGERCNLGMIDNRLFDRNKAIRTMRLEEGLQYGPNLLWS